MLILEIDKFLTAQNAEKSVALDQTTMNVLRVGRIISVIDILVYIYIS
jgi:hypothetical protein